MLTNKFSTGESYVFTPQPEPTALFGELREAEPVPWEALGPLADPIRSISTLTQAPAAIAMQSVLTVASTVTQGLADAESLHGHVPLSVFALTIAQSGERKSACDALATAAVKRVDQEREREYRLAKRVFEAELLEFQKGQRRKPNKDLEVIEGDLKDPDVDLAPEPPLVPTILISDVTIEGLHRRLETGTPSVAVMTDEGGQFFGGHSMKRENALKTAAGFSKLWDGSPISKSRASSEPSVLYGKRVSLHLMIQPGVAQTVVGDPMMKDQGLLSRVLIAWPDSNIGSRQITRDPSRIAAETKAKAKLLKFDERITELLNVKLPIHPETRADLDPHRLQLSDRARAKLEDFYNRVEHASNKGEAFEYITGFAAKAPEMAVRIAGVQTLYADEFATEITEGMMSNGISMMEWYLTEMLRVSDTGRPNQELCASEDLRLWLVNRWAEEFIDKRTMMKNGPGHLRDGNTLDICIKKLIEYGWLVREPGRQVINGANSKTYWRVVRRG
ncbi:YfjI family protein [uncultured Sulfitobacter sp.]|uniref:YfjI family protein n=1 Tax=Sulfitobacter sp. SH22 TaxID=3421172 RepID=UPI0025DE6E95|nr:YfjI family protein [uncultured Sulfitobacter sp.]